MADEDNEDVKHEPDEEEEDEDEEDEETGGGGATDDHVHTRLFSFIRHGEAEHNVAKKYVTDSRLCVTPANQSINLRERD